MPPQICFAAKLEAVVHDGCWPRELEAREDICKAFVAVAPKRGFWYGSCNAGSPG